MQVQKDNCEDFLIFLPSKDNRIVKNEEEKWEKKNPEAFGRAEDVDSNRHSAENIDRRHEFLVFS